MITVRWILLFALTACRGDVEAGNLDGDGRVDLVTANDGAGEVSVLLARAGGD